MIAKYVLALVILAMAAYQQFVHWQLKRRGLTAAFFPAQAAIFREITARARNGNGFAQLHHAALLGLLLWILFGFGFYLFKPAS